MPGILIKSTHLYSLNFLSYRVYIHVSNSGGTAKLRYRSILSIRNDTMFCGSRTEIKLTCGKMQMFVSVRLQTEVQPVALVGACSVWRYMVCHVYVGYHIYVFCYMHVNFCDYLVFVKDWIESDMIFIHIAPYVTTMSPSFLIQFINHNRSNSRDLPHKINENYQE